MLLTLRVPLIGVEVKGWTSIDKDGLKGFKAFEEDFKLEKRLSFVMKRV